MGDIMHKAKLMSRGSTETELDVATMFVLLELTTCSTPTSSVHRPSIWQPVLLVERKVS